MKTIRYLCTSSLLGLLFSTQAMAGIHTNNLSECLVRSTTTEDRTLLVKWMFSSISAHPAVEDISSITTKQKDDINKATAHLLTRLIADSCKDQTKKAMTNEGSGAISEGLKALGKVVRTEMFASPEVTATMSGLLKHLDTKKLQSIMD